MYTRRARGQLARRCGMHFEDVHRDLTRPVSPMCHAHDEAVESPHLGTAAQDDPSCPLSEPATFDEAFGKAIRSSLQPWSSTSMTMQSINMQLLFAAEWCRCQLCVVRGKLYLRGWRRSATKPGAPLAELLNGSRHHAAILGMAAMLRRHDVGDVCVTINCQDRPAVWKYYRSEAKSSAADSVKSSGGSTHSDSVSSVPLSRYGRPLLLSYMSSADHWDVPVRYHVHCSSVLVRIASHHVYARSCGHSGQTTSFGGARQRW